MTLFSYDFDAALAAAEAGRSDAGASFVDRVARGDFARPTNYGDGFATKTDLSLVRSTGTPTRDELSKHAKRFGSTGVRELVKAVPAEDSKAELVKKSELATITAQARKRSKRRRNLEQEARSLLERKPDLMPMAVADALNVSDRRARTLMDEIKAETA